MKTSAIYELINNKCYPLVLMESSLWELKYCLAHSLNTHPVKRTHAGKQALSDQSQLALLAQSCFSIHNTAEAACVLQLLSTNNSCTRWTKCTDKKSNFELSLLSHYQMLHSWVNPNINQWRVLSTSRHFQYIKWTWNFLFFFLCTIIVVNITALV